MKSLISTLAVIATLLFTIHLKAQEKQATKSLLWEISGKGLTNPSYIYGTIHMMCEPDFNIKDKTKKAFEKAEELVMELNFTDPAEIAELQKSMTSPIPLSKKLSPAQYKLLDSVLALKTGIPLKTMDQLTLTALSSFVITKTLPCTEIKSYEFEFANLAKKQQKPFGALETVKQQTEYFSNAFTDDMLVEQIANFDDYKSVFVEMIETYKAEDLNRLDKILKDKRFGSTKESDKWMLQIRNANWAKQIPEMMRNKSCFFAVGAGHLPGKKGILSLLKAQGYTVKPILN
ncbi:TraB/GumN family protein [Pedobacter sp. ASV1-7]|uniref:TraB/GumN family protein n=1 Tax=Pedobacter sp. ASV1-7 TaxID=3145237 RepID=UPI0032E91A96